MRAALVAGFSLMRRLQRNVPDLDECDREGRSIVLEIHLALLAQQVPTVTDEEVRLGIEAHMAASPFFPAPAELIEAVRQRRRQALQETTRQTALPPGPEFPEVAAEARQRLRGLIDGVVARFGFQPARRPTRSAAVLHEEVRRLRQAEGKPSRPRPSTTDGG